MDLVIRAALERLGGSADKVAARLAEEGCKGDPGESKGCPVTMYLREQLGLRSHEVLMVTRDYVQYYGRYEAQTPPAVAAFIDAFDGGKFAFLVRDGMYVRRHRVRQNVQSLTFNF